MGRAELTRLTSMRKTADTMGMLYRVVGKRGSDYRGETPDEDPSQLSLGPEARLDRLLYPAKITLKNVAGTFVFTNAGIEVKDVSGFIESNGLKIDGHIDGYRPDAPI